MIEPECLKFQGGFLTTGPPGKSFIVVLICISLMISSDEHCQSSVCLVWEMSIQVLCLFFIVFFFNTEFHELYWTSLVAQW